MTNVTPVRDVPDVTVKKIADALWPWGSPTPSWVEVQARALFADADAVRALIEWVGSVTEPEEG